MKQLAKGSFSYIYQHEQDDKVYIKSVCPMKECIALGWFPDSELDYVYFPEIEHVCTYEYTMKKYPRVTAPKRQLNAEAYAAYKELREYYNALPHIYNKHDSLNVLYKLTETIKNEKLAELIRGGLNGMSNYGSDMGFEISPRNISHDDNGNLILLDCFYSKSLLLKVNSDGAYVKQQTANY